MSDVSCHRETQFRNVDVRAAAAVTSTAPKRATRKAGAMCATHANADWMSPSATHAIEKCIGARGIDGLAEGERGRDGGHTWQRAEPRPLR